MIKKWLTILYIKWIMGECHHLCCLCKYRHQCEEDFDVNDLGIYLKQKSNKI